MQYCNWHPQVATVEASCRSWTVSRMDSQALADVVEFAVGDVADAADFAAAEVVDDRSKR